MLTQTAYSIFFFVFMKQGLLCEKRDIVVCRIQEKCRFFSLDIQQISCRINAWFVITTKLAYTNKQQITVQKGLGYA